MDDLRIERILRTVESIPVGAVATYGDVGKVVQESPRLVGRVLAQWGSNVPWWRVCNTKGEIPGHYEAVSSLWQQEGLPLKLQKNSLDLDACRIDFSVLAERTSRRLEPLTEPQP